MEGWDWLWLFLMFCLFEYFTGRKFESFAKHTKHIADKNREAIEISVGRLTKEVESLSKHVYRSYDSTDSYDPLLDSDIDD